MDEKQDRVYYFREDIQELRNTIESLQTKLKRVEEVDKRTFRTLASQIRSWKKVVYEEVGLSLGESLASLDSYHLYRLLFELLMELEDRLNNPFGEDQHTSAEARAIYFLALLARFVEERHHFPHKGQIQKLFDAGLELTSLDLVLADAASRSPLVRGSKARQKRHRLRNSVGVGDDGK